MIRLETPYPAGGINESLLREELTLAFGERLQGANYSADGTKVFVYLDPTFAGDQALVDSTVASHDPSGQSTEQAAAAQARDDRASLVAVDIQAELNYLDTAINNWATLTAGQKDTVLKRLCAENKVLIKLIRYLLVNM